MKNLIKLFAIALLFASCTPEPIEEVIEQPTNISTYKYELGFLQKFRGYSSTLVLTSNEPTTSQTFESGEGVKVEGVLTTTGADYHFQLTDIPTVPSTVSFYVTITETITDPNGVIVSTNIVQDALYPTSGHTAWALDYNVATNTLISTPQ